jgi:predicted permease
MSTYSVILSALVPVFLLMGMGVVAQRRGWLQDNLETGVMKLALNLLLPCLIFDLVVGNPALDDPKVVAVTVGFGFSIIVIGFVVSWLTALLFGLRKGFGQRTFTITAGIQNYGFMALPVTAMLFVDGMGNSEQGPMALIFIHGLGIELALWTVGVTILIRGNTDGAGTNAGPPWKLLINGPLIAVILSLGIHYSGVLKIIPEVLTQPVDHVTHMLGACAIPMCLFMIGATIGSLFERRVGRHLWRTAIAGCVARLAILPALMLVAAMVLPLPQDLKKIVVVQAGMPAALMPIVIARLYGGHPLTAIQVVLATMLISIGTAPLVIGLGIRWLGL